MSSEEYLNMSDSEKKKEDWMNSKWRPAMGWLYMLVCLCDFVIFPILHAIYVAALFRNGVPAQGIPAQWQPLTLQGAGLFHLAMGAVLGLAAFGRTQEKIAGAAFTPPTTPQPFTSSGFNSQPSTSGFNAPVASTPQPTVSKTGKLGPSFSEPEL